MAQLPPVPNVSRVVLNFTYDGQRCANVLHFVNNAGGGGADAADIGARIVAAWNTSIRPRVPTTCQLTSVTATPLDPGGESPSEYITGLPLAGSNASTAMPNNVTCVFSLRTGKRGRSFRGRIYHVGLTDVDVTANALLNTARDPLLAGYEDMRILQAGTGEAEHQLCVVSYYGDKAIRAIPLVTPVTSITTDAIIDSQRRRLPGRGR